MPERFHPARRAVVASAATLLSLLAAGVARAAQSADTPGSEAPYESALTRWYAGGVTEAVLWTLLALVALTTAALWASGRRPSGPRRFAVLTRVGAAATLLVALAALLAHGYDTPGAAAAWAGAAIVAVLLALRVGAASRSALVAAVVVGLIAFFFRWRQELLPANFYVDLSGPAGTARTFTLKAGGYMDFFRLLDSVFHVNTAFIHLWNVLASTGAVILVTLAALLPSRGNEADTNPRTRWILGLALGIALAVDPVLSRIAASAAPHNAATLVFGLGVLSARLVVADHRPLRKHPPSIVLLALTGAAALLIGLTRSELLSFAPLLVLLAVATEGAPRNRWIAALGAAGFGAALAAFIVATRPVGVSAQPTDGAQLLRWLASLWPIHWGAEGTLPPIALMRYATVFRFLLGGLLAVGFVGLFLRRRALALAILGVYVVALLPRLPTWVTSSPLANEMGACRYDMLVVFLYAYVAAWGAVFLYRTFAPLLPSARRIVHAGVMAFLLVPILVAGLLVPAGAVRRLTYEKEYAAISAALPLLPRGATVYGHPLLWVGPNYFADADLTLPHVLVAYERRDITWVALAAGDSLPAEPPPDAFYLTHASCSVDTELLADYAPPDTVALASEHREACAGAMSRVVDWLVDDEYEAGWTAIPVANDRIRVALGRLRGAR